jgi:hypothetical protein
MRLPPLEILLSWPAPNYIDPVTRSAVQIWVTTGIFLFLACACVLFRLYARIFVRRWYGFDDFFVVAATVSDGTGRLDGKL